MAFSLYVARRYLTSRSKRTFISVISAMSVLGVAIGVAALVIVMSVYNGVTREARDKILGINPHILILPAHPGAFQAASGEEGKTLPLGEPWISSVLSVPGVASVSPYLYAETLFSTPYGATGLVVRGINADASGGSLKLLEKLEGGKLSDFAPQEGVQGILVGRDLASRFRLSVGNRVNLMSPAGQKTSAGFVPKLRTFRVAGIYRSGMSDFDSRLAYAPLHAVQNVMGYPENFISGLEVFISDPYEAQKTAAAIREKLGPSFYTRNWIDMNANLFAALQMERFGMFIVLLMVILVGSFSIITSLVMLVMEKTRDIAILMSMGATAAQIRRIFMLQGALIGAAGTVLGYVLGIILALLLKKYQFIELPQGVYMMDTLPVIIEFFDLAVIGIVSMLLCFAATLYPSRQAARLVPAEALRYE